MSTFAAPSPPTLASEVPAGPAATPQPAPPPRDAACPLCGAPLDQRQEWCLSCGAAARTRLAAPTNWRAPLYAIAAIAAVALGVLAAALVSLSAGPAKPRPAALVTVTTTTTSPLFGGNTGAGTIPTTTGPTGITGAGAVGGAVAPSGTGGASPGTPTTISPGQNGKATTTPGLGGAGAGTGAGTGGGTGTTGGTGGASTTGAGTNGTTPGGRYTPAAEEALRKAGFLPRGKK